MLTIAFVISTLQLLAAASPSPSKNGVHRVALTRRQPHLPSAAADLVNLPKMVLGTINKYDEGFHFFEQNTGKAHPLIAGLTNNTKRAVAGEILAHDGDGLYTGPITIGTPPQTFNVGFDTGSASLLVVNAACTSTDCQNHRRYNPTVSTSSANRNQGFNLKVTDTQTVSGNQYTDTVALTGFGGTVSATGQVLGAANAYPTSFNSYTNPLDGRMGMGYQAISAYKAPSFPQTLVAQGATTQPVFGFRFDGPNPDLVIGDVDPAFTSQLVYSKVTTKGFWQINLDGVQVQNANQDAPQNVNIRTQAIIDTGSSLIIGDRANVDKLYAAIPGSQYIGNGMYSYPCDSDPTVSFVFGGTAFAIDPDSFAVGLVAPDSDQCVGAAVAAPTTKPPQRFWSFGDVFLQRVYSVFDLGANRVGFAALNP